jgi:hypothetical protein
MNEDTIRLRVYPAGNPKNVPKARYHWPDGAVVYHSVVNLDGSLRLGCALESVGDWAFAEYLVVPGTDAPDELDEYCGTHRANVLLGCPDELNVLPLGLTKRRGKTSGFGYELRQRGYRTGWAIVGCDLPRQLIALADDWSESRKTPGSWSMVLVGLGEWTQDGGVRRYRKFADAPRINLTVLGEHALISWGSTRKNDHLDANGNERRPANKSGPFVDILSAGSALAGGPVRDLQHVCRLFGVKMPTSTSSPVDLLRAETLAVAEIYRRQLKMIREMDLGLDLSNLVSTGGIATALLREMETDRS